MLPVSRNTISFSVPGCASYYFSQINTIRLKLYSDNVLLIIKNNDS